MELMNQGGILDSNTFMDYMQIGNHILYNNTLFSWVRRFSEQLWFFFFFDWQFSLKRLYKYILKPN